MSQLIDILFYPTIKLKKLIVFLLIHIFLVSVIRSRFINMGISILG